jgi:hypothetical protein
MPLRMPLVALLAIAAPVALVLDQSSSTSPWLQVMALESPAATGSGQPQLSVSERGVLLSWIERAGRTATLSLAERTASGWSEARTVASGSDWFVNWADVPSALRLSNGTLAAHWLQKSGEGTYAYDVRLSYSTDDGRTWAPSFTPHQDGTQTEHGFASLVEMPGGGLGLVWLDGREMSGGSHDASGHGGGGAMTLRFATYDTQWKQTSEMPIDGRVCECCPTTAVVTADGVLTAYRNRSDDEIRDIYVSRFANGAWSAPRQVHDDGWQLNACPVNGPMLAARGRDVVVAWFHARDGGGQAFVAFSNDAGRTFGAPIRVDDRASAGRVDVAWLPDGSALATWIESTSGGAELRARRLERSGARSSAVTVSPVGASRASGYPRVAVHGDEVVFAWTDTTAEGGPRIATATARVTAR